MTSQATSNSAAVELRAIAKSFGQTSVLSDIDLDFRSGEIHAVLGANGSGKSTLIKILAGYHTPTAGSINLHGRPLSLPVSRAQLHEVGVRFVHQDLGLFENLTVAENLALASGYCQRAGAIRWRDQHRSAERDLAAVGLQGVDPRRPVSVLGPVEKTLLAMARAIRDLPPDRGVLVLDEPTARLPHGDVDELLARCRVLRTQGVAMVYVSHRLDEVFAMADRVTVLRDGRVTLSRPMAETSEAELTALITGQPVDGQPVGQTTTQRPSVPRRDGAPLLRLRGLTGPRVNRVDLDVHPGEIVAITGLIGSGRSELGRLIFGSQRSAGGTVEFDGRRIVSPTPRASMSAGIGYVPQDRIQGGFPTFDLAQNVMIADPGRYLRFGALSPALQIDAATDTITRFAVRPAVPRRLLGELSGGNQQKVILGKWLRRQLKLLVLDEPTYGVDIGARETIMNTISSYAADGLAVLWLDSDIDLVVRHADRVVVMQQGRVVQELTGVDISTDRIAAASYAVNKETVEQ